MNKIITQNSTNKKISFNKYVNILKKQYIEKSFSTTNSTIKYLKNLNYLNRRTGEISRLTFDFMKHNRNNFLWYNFVSTYMQEKNSDKIAVFGTLTLNTSFHPYKTLKNKKHIINKKFVSADNSYKFLNNAFRVLYNGFRINRKKIPLQYLKVIEPHKDFTPHLHFIIYVEKKHIDEFKNHFNNILKYEGIGTAYDFTVLDNTNASVSYLLKYVKKTFATDNELEARVIDGWKKNNKIRMFTHSNIGVNREIFRVVSRYVDLKQDGNYSILKNLVNKVSLKMEYSLHNEVYKTKYAFNDDANIKVYVKKEKINLYSRSIYEYVEDLNLHKTRYFDVLQELEENNFNFYYFLKYYYEILEFDSELYYLSRDFDFKNYIYVNIKYKEFVELLEDYLYNCEYSYKSSYKIIEFKIYQDDKIVYDLKDYELVQIFNRL